jgi:flagellar hook-associated protein FlgK
MLRSTFYSFTTALRGLTTAQVQLDVTGQNISNVSTTGYTRQRADTYASTASGYGDKYGSKSSTLAGQGSVVSGISQIRNSFLDVRYRREASSLGEEDAKLSCMEDMELIFDEIESSGLRVSFSDFVSQLQSFANNADSAEFDSIVRDSASTLVNQLNQYATQLATIREEQEYQLTEISVNSINDLLSNIAELNKSIREEEVQGGSALELKDERNLLLDDLSTYMKIDVDYDQTEVSGGIIVNDAHISMVGADGSKTELIYNEAAATFSATVAGEKDATGATVQEAVVTIDTSDVQAKSILDTVNKAINSISAINKSLSANITDLATVTADLVQPTADLATNQALLAGGTVTDPDELASLNTTIANLQTTVDALTKTQTKLTESNTALLANRTKNEQTLTTQLGTFGIQVVPADTDADSLTVNDYTITLEDSDGNPINDADGNTISLISGTSGTKMTKDTLIQSGVTFTSTTANEVNATGSLKGVLDMLNSKGTYDYDQNEIRGIGYYEDMLDSLANQFATQFNLLNSTYTTNADGSITITEDLPLFETSDGSSTITASNIEIASGWLAGTYGLTATKETSTDGATGSNENILLMISQCSTKTDYNTSSLIDTDSYGNYLDKSGIVFANGIDGDGDYTLDGTKVANSDFVDIIDITDNGDGTYSNTATGTVIADGIDGDGDYTLAGLKIATSEGVPYLADGVTLDTTSSMAVKDGTYLYNGTYQEFLSNIGNVLSLDISTTSNLLENHTTIIESIQDSKDSISSVSIDEEGINMMQYQKAYNAAARLMTTLDEAVERIIDQMGTVGR